MSSEIELFVPDDNDGTVGTFTGGRNETAQRDLRSIEVTDTETVAFGTEAKVSTYYKSLDRTMIATNTLIYLYFIYLLENPLYIIISSVFICNALFCYFVSKLLDDSSGRNETAQRDLRSIEVTDTETVAFGTEVKVSAVKNSLHVFSHLFATSLFYFIHIF